MGLEANCQCLWGDVSGQAKVLLETGNLILRPAAPGKLTRRVVPIASLMQVEARGDDLHFRAGAETVLLTLGAAQAQSWAKKIAAPPPSLATKLGVAATTRLRLVGDLEADELRRVITQANSSVADEPDLILAGVKTTHGLEQALDLYETLSSSPPIWIIYPKGSNQPLGETEIRAKLRREGFLDTKVASISTTLTGLRFIKRS